MFEMLLNSDLWGSYFLVFWPFSLKILWSAQYWYKYSESSSTELSEYIYKYGANHKSFNKNGRKTKKLDPPRSLF